MAIFIKFKDIKGSSTDDKFKEQVEATSFQWGASLSVSNAQGGDRTNGTASVSEISISKQTDKASEKLFKSLLMGEDIGQAVISFVAASKGESVAYATLTIEEVIVSSFNMGSGGEHPTESLTLNFTKFDWSFTGRDAKQTGQPTHLIYSIVDAKVS